MPSERGKPSSIGDVFRISLDDGKVAYGQLIGFISERAFVAVFARLYAASEVVELCAVVDDELALATVLASTPSESGWLTLGRCAPGRASFAPAYRNGIDGVNLPIPDEVFSLDGLPRRRATAQDVVPKGVPISYPPHVEAALRVFHGLDQPFPGYERFLASNVRQIADAAGTSAIKFLASDLATPKPRPPEQYVTLRLPLDDQRFGSSDFRKYARKLADRCHRALSDARAGGFDSEGFGLGGFDLRLYGHSTDVMLRVLLPVFRKMNLPHGTSVVARYGSLDDPSAREERITLELQS